MRSHAAGQQNIFYPPPLFISKLAPKKKAEDNLPMIYAYLIHNELEWEGIDCHIMEENLSVHMPRPSNAVAKQFGLESSGSAAVFKANPHFTLNLVVEFIRAFQEWHKYYGKPLPVVEVNELVDDGFKTVSFNELIKAGETCTFVRKA